MSEELEVLWTVARRLDETRIAYMLTGSMALNYYAVQRMTRDVDLMVDLGPDDADRVIRLFEPAFYVDAVRRALAPPGMFNMRPSTGRCADDHPGRSQPPVSRSRSVR